MMIMMMMTIIRLKKKKYDDMPDLETEEDATKRMADSYEQKKDKIN